MRKMIQLAAPKNIQLTAVTGDNRIFDAALQTKKQKQNKILNKTILSG